METIHFCLGINVTVSVRKLTRRAASKSVVKKAGSRGGMPGDVVSVSILYRRAVYIACVHRSDREKCFNIC